jgi:DNA-binding MarR family transcriptional regulator
MDEQSMDAVDRIVQQWKTEKPDLPSERMGPIGRLKRCTALLEPLVTKGLDDLELTVGEFDVLATLRRAGAPYLLAPTDLFYSLMVTSGTMTHRLKGLEQRGLISRCHNPEDARSMLVQLTDDGLALIDRAVVAHVENLGNILSRLSAREVEALDQSLRTVLMAFDEASG